MPPKGRKEFEKKLNTFFFFFLPLLSGVRARLGRTRGFRGMGRAPHSCRYLSGDQECPPVCPQNPCTCLHSPLLRALGGSPVRLTGASVTCPHSPISPSLNTIYLLHKHIHPRLYTLRFPLPTYLILTQPHFDRRAN